MAQWRHPPSSLRFMHGWRDAAAPNPPPGSGWRKLRRQPRGRNRHVPIPEDPEYRLPRGAAVRLWRVEQRDLDGRRFQYPRHPGGRPSFSHRLAECGELQSRACREQQRASLLQITGDPVCGVDFYYVRFWTVGAASEATESSGAMMVPTGMAAGCSGPRPMVLYAHGTTGQDTQHCRYHQYLQYRRRVDSGHVRGAGLHRRGAELRRLRHLDPGLSSLPERRAAIRRDDRHSDGGARGSAEHHEFGDQRRRQVVRHRLFGRGTRGHGHATGSRGERCDGHRRGAHVRTLCAGGIRRCNFLR